ncbi:MAG: hypothetical protein WCD79_07740 [Chthoniobacteraceae bacterium]
MRLVRNLLKKVRNVYSSPRDVFLKQYGEKRTGTNFIRAALLANYTNAVPLMHALGDKHSPPVDLRVHLDGTALSDDPAREFVGSATFAVPAESTRADDPDQAEYLNKIAPALASSVREGRLGFLISLKHPRPWVVSIANYNGWITKVNGCWQMGLELAPELEAVCKGYNKRHESWLALHLENETRSMLVHHERLIDHADAVMGDIEDKFDLQRRNWSLELPEKKVEPAQWDHNSTGPVHAFDSDYYRSKRYEEVLGPELWAVVERAIDWKLMERFGYGREP